MEDSYASEPLFAACALLNVALVAAAFWLLYRRDRRRVESGRRRLPRRWHYAVVPATMLASVLLEPAALLLGVAGLPSLPLGLGISLIFSYYWTVLLGMPCSLWGGDCSNRSPRSSARC